MGTESSSTLCVDPHAHPHMFPRRTHTGSLKYTYVQMRRSQSKRGRERKREIFWGLFYGSRGRENKVLPNFGKHGVVFARPVKRSVSIGNRQPVCTHTHRKRVRVRDSMCAKDDTGDRVSFGRAATTSPYLVTIIKYSINFLYTVPSNPQKLIYILRILFFYMISFNTMICFFVPVIILYIKYIKKTFNLIIIRCF